MLGKERGYLLLDDVNNILPAEVNTPEEVNDLLATLERYGINIYEDVTAAKAAVPALEGGGALETEAKEEEASGQEVELDLTPSLLDKTTDPVRMYLREMGSVP